MLTKNENESYDQSFDGQVIMKNCVIGLLKIENIPS